jgi:hypothetical protein
MDAVALNRTLRVKALLESLDLGLQFRDISMWTEKGVLDRTNKGFVLRFVALSCGDSPQNPFDCI